MPRIGEAYIDFSTRLAKFKEGITEAQTQLKGFTGFVSENAQKFRQAGVYLTMFSAALTAVAGKGVAEFAKFQEGMLAVSTMLEGIQMKSMPGFTQGIKDLSIKFGESTTSLSKGLYDILSAAIPPAKAMEVLTAVTLSAKAGFSDAASAGRAVISVLNAYQLSGEKAGDVADWLFATVKRGVFTFPELADAIGKVLPVAASAGISLEELGAMIAIMSRSGLNAREATTALRQVIATFLSPTKEAIVAARGLGLELNTATLRSEGLRGVMAKLATSQDENVAKIFGNIRALTGLLPALKNQQSYMEDLSIITNRAGVAQEAFEKASSGVTFKLSQLQQTMNILFVTIGEKLEPFVKTITDIFMSLMNVFINLNPAISNFIVIAGTLIGVLGTLLGITLAIAGAIAVIGAPVAGTILLIYGIIAAVGLVTAFIITQWDTIVKVCEFGWKTIVSGAKTAYDSIMIFVGLIWEGVKKAVQAFFDPFHAGKYMDEFIVIVKDKIGEFKQIHQQAGVELQTNIANLASSIKGQTKETLDELKNGVKETGSVINNEINNSGSNAESQLITIDGIGQTTFRNVRDYARGSNLSIRAEQDYTRVKAIENYEAMNKASKTFNMTTTEMLSGTIRATFDVMRGTGNALETFFNSVTNRILDMLANVLAQSIMTGQSMGSIFGGGGLGGVLGGIGTILGLGIPAAILGLITQAGKKTEIPYTKPTPTIPTIGYGAEVTRGASTEYGYERGKSSYYIPSGYEGRGSVEVKKEWFPDRGWVWVPRDMALTPGELEQQRLRGYAIGGVAWERQVATLAEKEPELVTPFSKLGELLSGGDTYVYITAQKVDMEHIEQIADGISDALRRRNPSAVKLSKLMGVSQNKFAGESI